MAEFDVFIQNLLNRTDIVALVSKYVRLTKKGGTYWGCCPFHNEKTPSFSVSESRQMFYCFGCQTGGNAITFLAKIESIEKIDAIKQLAAAAGMTLPEREYTNRTDKAGEEKKRIRLLALLKDAAQHYHQNLSLPQAKPAHDYLDKRKIEEKMITRFGMGYSLGFDEVIKYLLSKGYTNAEMKEAGIAAQKADSYYDTFFKRLMIPIIDISGNVTGFGGRILTNEDFAKYKNSPQSLVFDKSKNLFAVNLVKKKKQKDPASVKHLIIAEGYMDVISLHKAGFDTAVASMGTALTLNQARIIKNLTSNVYISYDGDAAGQKGTLRGLDILENAGLNVRVICLPDKTDPDDAINKSGTEYYRRLMKEALPLTAFKLFSLKPKYVLTTPDGKSNYAKEAVAIIARLENPVEREEYLKTVNAATGYSMQVLYKQAELPQPDVPPAPRAEQDADITSSLDAAKEFILAELIAAKPYVDLKEDIYSLLEDEPLRRVFCLIMDALKSGEYKTGALYSAADGEDEQLIAKLASYQSVEGDGAEKYLSCVRLLKLNALERRKAQIIDAYKETKDIKLLEELKNVQAEEMEIKR